jgi:hypothetical protein
MDASKESQDLLSKLQSLVIKAHPSTSPSTVRRGLSLILTNDPGWTNKVKRSNDSKILQSFLDKCNTHGLSIHRRVPGTSSKAGPGKRPRSPPAADKSADTSTASSSRPTTSTPKSCSWEEGRLQPHLWSHTTVSSRELTRGGGGIALMSLSTFKSSSVRIRSSHNSPTAVLMPAHVPHTDIQDACRDLIGSDISEVSFLFEDPILKTSCVKRGLLVQLSDTPVKVTQVSLAATPILMEESSDVQLTFSVHAACVDKESFRSASKDFRAFASQLINVSANLADLKLMQKFSKPRCGPSTVDTVVTLPIADAHHVLLSQRPLNRMGVFVRPTSYLDPQSATRSRGVSSNISDTAAIFSYDHPVVWLGAEVDFRQAIIKMDSLVATASASCLAYRDEQSVFGIRTVPAQLSTVRAAVLPADRCPPESCRGVVGKSAFIIHSVPRGTSSSSLQAAFARGEGFQIHPTPASPQVWLTIPGRPAGAGRTRVLADCAPPSAGVSTSAGDLLISFEAGWKVTMPTASGPACAREPDAPAPASSSTSSSTPSRTPGAAADSSAAGGGVAHSQAGENISDVEVDDGSSTEGPQQQSPPRPDLSTMGFSSSSSPLPILLPALAKAPPKHTGPPPLASPHVPPPSVASAPSAVPSPTTPEDAIIASKAAAAVQLQLDLFKANVTRQLNVISAAVDTLKTRADQTAADTGAKFDRILQLLSNPSSSSSSSGTRSSDRTSERSRSRGDDKREKEKLKEESVAALSPDN